MLRVPVAIVIGSMLWATASTSMALGFGQVSNATVLGDPLDFSASLNINANESVAPECVAAEVSAGDIKLAPALVHARLVNPPGGGQPRVRVQTLVRIDEPVVTVSVTVGCPARLSRQFVAFIDPPSVDLPTTRVANARPSVAPSGQGNRVAPGVAGSPTALASEAPAPPRRAKRPASMTRTAAVAATAPATVSAVPTPTAPNSATAARSTARAPGPRLSLELAPPVISDPVPAPAASAVAAVSEVTSSADTLQRARDRERLLGLEETLDRMRRENAATQQNLAALQLRLREAEAARRTSPAVYGLWTLVVLLLIAIAVLLWRQSRMRRDPEWWSGSEMESAREASVLDVPQPARDDASERTATEMRVMPPPLVPEVTEEALPPPPRPAVTEPPETSTEAARRELSVEELIDLEQQAEFFVVLGQDEAAIDLLMGHVRSSGGASPMPYLKLLDIYRRRSEREAYERIRERFNRRFNAYAPDWETDPQEGRPLESYPDVVQQLQAAWPTSSQAMDLLESLMFRRDSSESTFDLPAYGELLFLYSQARDLAERDTAPGCVDLLLPLGSSNDEPMIRSLPSGIASDAEPAFAASASMDLDLDLDAPGPATRH